MRVVVTGASGFIGRRVVAALLTSGADVQAVSRQPPPVDCPWRQLDLFDADAVARAIGALRPDRVLHLAWCVEHGKFWTDMANTDWVAATLSLARACADAGVQHFSGVGTCYEYDWPADGDCREDHTPLAAHTPYDIAKTRCRAELEALFAEAGAGFAWARLFSLYGPEEDARRLVASVAHALSRGEAAGCSRGLAVRDFMDVRDAGAALAAISLSGFEGAINVASGEARSVAEMATALGRLANRPELIQLGALADRPDEPPRIVADVTRLREMVGFRPRYDLASGLSSTLDYWVREGRAGS